MMQNQKSIKLNATLNIISTVLSLVFPLITLPYVTRVLQTESYGRVVYANSIVSYFILFAGLGTASYALREGAGVRDDRNKFNELASQVFTLNMFTTLCSYVLLAITLVFIPRFQSYIGLCLIFALGILFSTLSVSWIYQAHEEYIYITSVNIFTHAISVLLILTVVKGEEDIYKYAFIRTLSYIIPGVFNFLRVHKICKLRIMFTKKIFVHLRPILVLFASSIATTIYVSSDTTILGYISGDYYTGLYAASSQIYSVVKNIIIAALTVSIPRFSYYYNNKEIPRFNDLLKKIVSIMCMLAFPMALGICSLSEEIILLLFGNGYVEATNSLRILGFTVPFCMFAWIASQCILIPTKREKIILESTIAGGIINVVLNILLIPAFQHNATAFTTFISELSVCLIYFYKTKGEWHVKEYSKHLVQCVVATLVMVLCIAFVKTAISSTLLKIVICVPLGAIIYFTVLLLFRNEVVCEYGIGYVKKILEKIRGKKA